MWTFRKKMIIVTWLEFKKRLKIGLWPLWWLEIALVNRIWKCECNVYKTGSDQGVQLKFQVSGVRLWVGWGGKDERLLSLEHLPNHRWVSRWNAGVGKMKTFFVSCSGTITGDQSHSSSRSRKAGWRDSWKGMKSNPVAISCFIPFNRHVCLLSQISSET